MHEDDMHNKKGSKGRELTSIPKHQAVRGVGFQERELE